MSATVDLEGTQVHYADSLNLTTVSLTPAFRVSSRRVTLDAVGSYANGREGRWSTQGMIGGGWFVPLTSLTSSEVAATIGGTSNADGVRTGQLLASGRLYRQAGSGGLWLGASGGTTWDGIAHRGLLQGDAGGWLQWENTVGSVTVTPTRVGDTVRYVDTELALQWMRGRMTAGITGSTRSGRHLPVLGGSDRATWGSVDFMARLLSRVALVASVGTYPVNWTQGFPGGRFFSAGIRMTMHETSIPASRMSTSATTSARLAPLPTVRITTRVAQPRRGYVTISVRTDSAQRVELTGDLTNWQPVTLRRSATGWWSVRLPARSGTHQINVRINGGPWRVPDDLTALNDELGGAVGLLVIP